MNTPFTLRTIRLLLLAVGINAVTELKAQQAPQFNSWQLLTNREMVLRLSSAPGYYYRLEAGSNITQWAPLVTEMGSASQTHTDSAAPYLMTRYYRAVTLTNTSGLVTGDHLPTSEGDAIIHPGKHAGLMISWNNLALYFDPTNVFSGLPRADMILITHTHNDHLNQSVISNVMGAAVTLVAPQAVYNNLSTYLRGRTTVLTNGMTTNLLGVGVEAFAMYNTNGLNHSKGAGNGYVLTLGGKRLYVAGDTQNTPEMYELRNIDVAFLPMNQFTMTTEMAVSVTRGFQPRVVYPYHYAGRAYNEIYRYKDLVGQDLGIEVRLRNWY